MLDDVERAAALDARRRFLIDEVDRHLHADLRACDEALEIHMHRRVLDHVELVVARNGADLLALDIDLENGGEEMTRIDQRVRFLVVERDGDGAWPEP